MGIPTTAFQTGELYIEYPYEDILFLYEYATGRFFAKRYNPFEEFEIPP